MKIGHFLIHSQRYSFVYFRSRNASFFLAYFFSVLMLMYLLFVSVFRRYSPARAQAGQGREREAPGRADREPRRAEAGQRRPQQQAQGEGDDAEGHLPSTAQDPRRSPQGVFHRQRTVCLGPREAAPAQPPRPLPRRTQMTTTCETDFRERNSAFFWIPHF